jgi:hypothetical protein
MIDLRALFTLFLLIGVNFLDDLYSCRIKDVMRNSMIAKHIVAFLTLHIFVTLTSKEGKEEAFIGNIKKSVVVYLMFLISTRVRYEFFWIFVVGLLVYYAGSLYVERHEGTLEKLPSDLERRTIERRIKQLNEYLSYLLNFLLVVLAVGFLIFLGEKRAEYGERFDFGSFMVGDLVCGKDSPRPVIEEVLTGFKGGAMAEYALDKFDGEIF